MINMESLDGKNLSFQRDVGNVTKNPVLFSSSRLYDVTPKVPQTSPKSKLVHCPIDWLNCILCQTHSREALQCPALIKRKDVSKGAGYETLLSDISSYHEVGYFPVPINSTLLGEQKDVVEFLLKNEAKWHKNCRNKFSKLKLTRLHKHKLKVEVETDSSTPNKITRKSCGAATVADCKKCFFCNTESGDLHQASTI
ncbi:uncharacterized protein LOC132742404 [Ruditapes philippinarum]|uniref:uncharacterized protein LOC132742404 n=1 Tax=Ruditapes philippinarum TaxID=129788 RepID=UPI00295AD934|nr:uncharacterized protein LOC132742404 [Ruditapes philippinarum]